ncbi:phage scaffolding protein [uncultured Anaerococcus sp.]|uniref:phage scaffolding protein n=1 Tax=uncultured Anaerococcus sp. TaxID=293428 RepID=UPI0026113EF6|nr:phage scaffolding protein [uncultured Anaerococcus sp.]
MKTEELKELGLTDEQIKEVFRLNGLDLKNYQELKENNQALSAENDSLKNSLNEANTTIEGFKDKDLDIEEIKKQADDYKAKFEESQVQRQKDIEAIKLDNTINLSLLKSGAKNTKAVRALLDIDNLKESKNLNDDLETQIKNLQESDSYLFKVDDEADKRSMGRGNNLPPKDISDMSYLEIKKMQEKGKK